MKFTLALLFATTSAIGLKDENKQHALTSNGLYIDYGRQSIPILGPNSNYKGHIIAELEN